MMSLTEEEDRPWNTTVVAGMDPDIAEGAPEEDGGRWSPTFLTPTDTTPASQITPRLPTIVALHHDHRFVQANIAKPPSEGQLLSTAIPPRAISVASSEEHPSCADRVLSIRFILPITVTLIVSAMAATTIGLMAANTESAVDNVVHSLQDQVSSIVQNRIEAQLQQVLEINRATVEELVRIDVWPSVDNATGLQPSHQQIYTILDKAANSFQAIDAHYMFSTEGRLMANSKINSTHIYYVEEFYPLGIKWWPYQRYDVVSLANVYANPPAIFTAGYVGYKRAYFQQVSRTQPYDYLWTQPYKVGPMLFFSGTMTIIDKRGIWRGVIGSNAYVPTLQAFLVALKPTPRTKMFVVGTDGLLAMSSHGRVLDDKGGRLMPTATNDTEVVAASAVIGDFTKITGDTRMEFDINGDKFMLSVKIFDRVKLRMFVAVLTPKDEFLGAAQQRTTVTTVICCVIAFVGIVVIVGLCIKISVSLYILQRNLARVSRLEFDDCSVDDTLSLSPQLDLPADADTPAQSLRDMSLSMSTSSRSAKAPSGGFTELRQTNATYLKLRNAVRAFKHYVPEHVVRGVITGDIQASPGMKQNEIVVSFQDVADFTSLCETMPTTYVVQIVSRCFERMSAIIQLNDGTIDKYIGDAIMAYWAVGHRSATTGEHLDLPAMCARAVHSVQRSKECFSQGVNYAVTLRSGLHCGAALIGNFGSTSRFNYTVVGDTVNTAARLEPLNKETKTRALASQQIVQQLPCNSPLLACLRDVGDVLLVGKNVPITMYEIREEPLSSGATHAWELVMKLFRDGNVRGASETLLQAFTTHPNELAFDPPSQRFAAMLEDMLNHPDATLPPGLRRQNHK
jgi:class 3 adenylate cyclase